MYETYAVCSWEPDSLDICCFVPNQVSNFGSTVYLVRLRNALDVDICAAAVYTEVGEVDRKFDVGAKLVEFLERYDPPAILELCGRSVEYIGGCVCSFGL